MAYRLAADDEEAKRDTEEARAFGARLRRTRARALLGVAIVSAITLLGLAGGLVVFVRHLDQRPAVPGAPTCHEAYSYSGHPLVRRTLIVCDANAEVVAPLKP